MIDIDSDEWANIPDCYNRGDKIPTLLRQLKTDTSPKDDYEAEPWFSLWSSLCHQGDIYPASFAVVPHIVKIGIESSKPLNLNFFVLPKEIEISRLKKKMRIPDNLVVDYLTALSKLRRIKQHLANDPTPIEVGYLSGSKFDEGQEGICRQCKHELAPHLITAPYGTTVLEGEIFCPVEGCTCFHTWSVAKKQEK